MRFRTRGIVSTNKEPRRGGGFKILGREKRSMELIGKLTISTNAVARQVGDDTVILHLGSGTYFGLDAVGARIWQLMEEGKSVNEICDVMLDEYEVSREDLEHDITGLIKDLVAQDLVSTS
jgi:hypothetical protein